MTKQTRATTVLSMIALGVVAACAPQVPDSGAGVGFESYSDYQARQSQQLQGQSLPAPATVSSAPLGSTAPLDPDAQLAADTAAALNSGRAPLEASPSNPAPVAVNAAGISQENDFEEVSELRSIESDAAAIARNRAQYVVVQPTELPRRSGDGGPNIVEYAIRTTNPKGVSLYRRSSLNFQNYERNCAEYPSADQAQIDFLARGGPQRDRRGLDPDGDGFACDWDPRPFRSAVQN
ncbi:hypothetical protein PVW53_10860 [Seohaeicola sp. SP36]|jgi:hypothetical protein|uniref:hypothetical protein n=1 Tax=unclassified Seohaeicola TaxID=2641111 RepID=UPI00237BCFAC|nr:MULTISPECIES: hypothetical protein [unclassified Seohaeicola]MDD9708059.1 hypothetical protein [Seohaeicola sp. 4SK31]MDD9736023.1 hypothetical protein [Seohaeicola sp. SP36]